MRRKLPHPKERTVSTLVQTVRPTVGEKGMGSVVLTEILPRERAFVALEGQVSTKDAALRCLSRLLAGGSGDGQDTSRTTEFYRILCEREALQSTGIGDGVAIPHGAMEGLESQRAALLVCPEGLPFEAIDGRPVRILFAVVGPKRTTGEHLKTLARVSRLLRDAGFREKLLLAKEGAHAWALVRQAEDGRAA